jgi:hypothetical protein
MLMFSNYIKLLLNTYYCRYCVYLRQNILQIINYYCTIFNVSTLYFIFKYYCVISIIQISQKIGIILAKNEH